MATILMTELQEAAARCVVGMGDIFWDWDHFRGERDGYTNPLDVASEAVLQALMQCVQRCGATVE